MWSEPETMATRAEIRASVPESMLVHNLGEAQGHRAVLEHIIRHPRREEFVVAHISQLQAGVNRTGELWWGVHDGPDTGGIQSVWARVVAQRELWGALVVAEDLGVDVWNPTQALCSTADKWQQMVVLAGADIPVPETVLVHQALEADDVGAQLGWPLVIKPARGMQSQGVMLIKDPGAWGIAQGGLVHGKVFLAQRFVPTELGGDVRAYVVGGAVVGAVRRVPKLGDWIGTGARGGSGTRIELDEAASRCAVMAAEALEGMVVGVDLVLGPTGPVVLEVNTNPGLLAAAEHGIDLIAEVLDAMSATWHSGFA